MTEEVLWFFGGYKASLSDMNLWKASADHQNVIPYVTAFSYPVGASASYEGAVEGFGDRLDTLVQKLGSYENSSVVIVGHSSGCAISNEIGLRAFRKGIKNFRVIALDGFAPHHLLFENKMASVWSAKCGSTYSMNYQALVKVAGPYFHTYQAQNCHTKWALHFSLVNKSATDDLVKKIPDGYKHCVANLEWL